MTTVLIVDDTPVDRRLAGGLLEKSAYVDELLYANDGQQALEHVRESRPDLVVTDMQMPVMDGLELVTQIRLQFPDIPVILMTARGSEQLAAEALQQGASSYVPKSHLHEILQGTVENILSIASADKTYGELMQCQDQIEFVYSLPSNPALVDGLVDLIQQIIHGMQFTDVTGKFRIGVAVREALLNAMFRGNLEISFEQIQEAREEMIRGGSRNLIQERASQPPYNERRVHVKSRISQDEASFVIRDDGPGFDFAREFSQGDLSTVGSLEAKQGRGLILMRSFMDQVNYNEKGNEVTLIKSRDSFA